MGTVTSYNLLHIDGCDQNFVITFGLLKAFLILGCGYFLFKIISAALLCYSAAVWRTTTFPKVPTPGTPWLFALLQWLANAWKAIKGWFGG